MDGNPDQYADPGFKHVGRLIDQHFPGSDSDPGNVIDLYPKNSCGCIFDYCFRALDA